MTSASGAHRCVLVRCGYIPRHSRWAFGRLFHTFLCGGVTILQVLFVRNACLDSGCSWMKFLHFLREGCTRTLRSISSCSLQRSSTTSAAVCAVLVLLVLNTSRCVPFVRRQAVGRIPRIFYVKTETRFLKAILAGLSVCTVNASLALPRQSHVEIWTLSS